jgi:hypothetical protein
MSTPVDSCFNYKLKMNVVKFCKHNPMLKALQIVNKKRRRKRNWWNKKKHKHCCVVRSKNIIKETKAM